MIDDSVDEVAFHEAPLWAWRFDAEDEEGEGEEVGEGGEGVSE